MSQLKVRILPKRKLQSSRTRLRFRLAYKWIDCERFLKRLSNAAGYVLRRRRRPRRRLLHVSLHGAARSDNFYVGTGQNQIMMWMNFFHSSISSLQLIRARALGMRETTLAAGALFSTAVSLLSVSSRLPPCRSAVTWPLIFCHFFCFLVQWCNGLYWISI